MSYGKANGRRRARGFSLIEMLTVLGILALVLAIIVPAIAKARTTARRADTAILLNQVGNACQAFKADERREPGYFSQLEMGSPTNASQVGFDNMTNIMFDLIGGIVPRDTTATGTVLEAGPFTVGGAENIKIDTSKLGAQRQTNKGTIVKGYFQFDPKRFIVQNGGNGGGLRMAGSPNSANTIYDMPVLVDTFGTPVLAWVLDDAPAAAVPTAPFARETAAANARSRFYWGTNAGFVNSARLGKLGENQNDTDAGSLLSSVVVASAPSRAATLAGLLGDPSSPVLPLTNPAVPTRARSPILLHSAGERGVYLGKSERGGRVATGTSNEVRYVANQDPITGGGFDDMIQAAGN